MRRRAVGEIFLKFSGGDPVPVADRQQPAASQAEPSKLRPYKFHGVDLSERGAASDHAVGTCPFCTRDGKFSVDVRTGLWRCFVCGEGTAAGGGNGLVFARLLHQNAAAAASGGGNGFLAAVAQDRKLLHPETVAAWGVARAGDGVWMVAGYGADGRLDQVYRRIDGVLMPTPGLWPEGKVHALHMPAGDFDPARPCLVVCEGPWDGMALWEAWDRTVPNTNIVAVPGCTTWRAEWTQLCRGKSVVLLYDSDHPRGKKNSVAGYDGMARVAKKLSGVAASVRYIRWGAAGYDPARSSGWDVRDFITEVR